MAREPLADAFFGFPDSEEADLDFVTDAIGLFEYPVIVVDRDLSVITANLQGHDTLRWVRLAGSRGGEYAQGTLPGVLADIVKPRIRKRTHEILKDVRLLEEPPYLNDVFISKGRIQGKAYTFIVLMTATAGQHSPSQSALQAVLDGVSTGALAADVEGNFAYVNAGFLDLVGFTRDELVGHHLTEFNPSEQAGSYARLFKSLIDSPRVLRSPAVTYPTIRRGTFVSPVTAWTMTGAGGRGLGIVVIAGLRLRSEPESVRAERRHILLERATDLMGDAIFITDLDGRMLVKNPAADDYIREPRDREEFNIKTDVPWEIPETIEEVFAEAAKGKEHATVRTGVYLPRGKAILDVRVHGLRRMSDVIQEIVFVCRDITREEYLKQDLFSKTAVLVQDRKIRDTVLDNIGIPFIVLDADFKVITGNSAVARRFGVAREDMNGRHITELNPELEGGEILRLIGECLESNRVIRREGQDHVTHGGKELVLDLSLIPIELGGRKVCLAIAESESETATLKWGEIAGNPEVASAALDLVGEGIFLVDKDGTFLDVNRGVTKGSSLPKQEIVGKSISDLVGLTEEKDVFMSQWQRALASGKLYHSGTMVSRTRVDGLAQVVDASVQPLKGRDGSVERYVIVVKYLSEVLSLKQQLKDYMSNLEGMVSEKTHELRVSNALLADTAERVARIARSRDIMTSFRDRESVIRAFLVQLRGVVGAGFAGLLLQGEMRLREGPEFHPLGDAPGKDEPVSHIIEESRSRMVAASDIEERVRAPLENVLVADFSCGTEGAILICVKGEGRFTSIDVDLVDLLCTQLSLALPAARYVSDLRRERDRAEAMRRMVFRIAGVASVKEAVRVIAQEVSTVVPVDRFLWLIDEGADRVWATEIILNGDAREERSAHLDLRGVWKEATGKLGKAGHSEELCGRVWEEYTRGPAVGLKVEGAAHCPFVREGRDGGLVSSLCGELAKYGFFEEPGGACAVVPVPLSEHSSSYLCAKSRSATAFPADEICYMCLAASAVSHVWLEADAASSIRRLETTGETVSELAHDFRYPMRKITQLLERLASGEVDAAGSRESASSLLADVRHLSQVTREFIDLSRPGGGRPEFADLTEVFGHCLAIASEDLERKSVSVIKKYGDSPLPPVFVSRRDLMRIFINLIANSYEAVDEGGTIEVEACVEDSGDGKPTVVLSIWNSGPPVPDEVRENLFSPFASGKDGGTGLGLFSARRRAKANGGDIELERDAWGRDNFRVWFPAAFE